MNMKKTIARKAFPVVSAVLFAAIAIGCGDDSSSSPTTPNDQVPGSSASVDTTTPTDQTISSAAADICVTDPNNAACASTDPGAQVPESSAAGSVDQPIDNPLVENPVDSPAVVPVATSFNRDPALANLSITPDTSGFYDVGDIYKAVPADGKIVFVLRHGERESGLGKESPLTEVGVQQAFDVGVKLSGSDDSFYYASTDFLRTRTTAAKIAEGRGDAAAEVDTLDIINGGYFLTVPSDSLDDLMSKRGGTLRPVSQWAYGVEFSSKVMSQHAYYFYDLFERGDQFINEVILANLPNWKRVNVLISHDLLTEPLAVYASNRTADLKTYENQHWINYVAGIAVVVGADGLVTLLPARGAEQGFLNTKDAY